MKSGEGAELGGLGISSPDTGIFHRVSNLSLCVCVGVFERERRGEGIDKWIEATPLA